MNHFVFPDNTVLCNFAAVARLDLLESALNGRDRWTEAVAYEARQSARILPELSSIENDGWLGKPIEIAATADITQVERIRRAVFGGGEDKPLQHLGEAQTCFVLREWQEFSRSWWVSDDRESLAYARRQDITTFETIDLVRVLVAYGELTCEAGYRLLHTMIDYDRQVRVPATAGELRE